jgi:hypothetical protein
MTATATLNGSDQITGGTGTDTLKMYGVTAALFLTNTPLTVTGLEKIQIANAVDAGVYNFGALTKAATGLETIQFDNASAVGANAITTTTGQTLSLATGSGGVASAGTTIWAASAVDASLTLNLNGYQGGSGVTPIGLTVTGAAATTLNITSIGAANKVGVSATSFFTGPTTVTKHVVTGDQALGIVLAAADALKVATVDASAATGDVTYNHLAAVTAAGNKFTGGSGNDTVIFASDEFGTLTAGTQLVGGTGTDKIGLFDTAVTAAEAAKINAATGFEKIGLNAAITLDASSLSNFKTFDIDTTALTQTIASLATGTTINVGHGTGATFTQTSLTLSGAVGVTDATIVIGATTDTTAHTVTNAVLTGLTSVKITSNGTATNVFDTVVMVNSDNSSFTINGSAALTMGRIVATTTGSKIDASAATGVITMVGNTTAFATGSALGDILIGGSAADSITASINGGTLTGNGGNDTFNVTVALGGVTTTFNTTTITDFTKGDKIVTTSAGTGVFTTTAVTLSGAASVGAALDLLAAGDGSTNAAIKWGVFGGNTYLVEDLGAGATFAATDIMVKITGVHDLSTSTFVEGTGTLTYA